MEALVICTVVSAGVLIADGVKYAQTHWVVCGASAPDAEDDAPRRAAAQPVPWSWIPEGLIIPPPLPSSPKKKQR